MRRKRYFTATAVVALFLLGPTANATLAQSNPFLSSQPGYPNWSPFTGIKWEKDRPIVEVQGKWYALVSIHGVSTDDILKKCQKEGWDTRKRVAEDLVQILRLMGKKIDKTTHLVLRDQTRKVVTMKDVAMTEANLYSIARSAIANITLSRKDALEDLRFFQASLESQFSYLKANRVDYKAAIQQIADQVKEETNQAWLAQQLQTVIARFIDGHAGVSGATSLYERGFLPFLIEPSGDRFVAILPDRSGFLSDKFPYLKSLDGIELQRWLRATEKYVAKGSPQYRRRYGLRHLSAIQQFRKELGLPRTATLKVEFVSRDGKTTQTQTVKVSDSSRRGGDWPPKPQPQILDGNIGYLHLRSMNGNAVRLLKMWMPRFRETDGLIIDVRGNGGGIRTPILELAGYLLSKDDAPRIGNVAKYRLAKEFGEDHLSRARYVYREDSARFGERQRAAIAEFKKTFKPEWTPPKDEFSQWHYLVLSKDADDPRFDYRRAVAILLDGGCFSATDIFLGAFKGWPRVTLVGQPSGGGSARTQQIRLPNSGISIRCASMASFQPTGQLYDSRGVQPDILVVRPPEYYLQNGKDVILETAIRKLKGK